MAIRTYEEDVLAITLLDGSVLLMPRDVPHMMVSGPLIPEAVSPEERADLVSDHVTSLRAHATIVREKWRKLRVAAADTAKPQGLSGRCSECCKPWHSCTCK